MNEHLAAAAEKSLRAAYDGTIDFPAIVGLLIEAGFESYWIDYRRGAAIYYLPSGESTVLELPADEVAVAAEFDGNALEDAIREAQSASPGYSYAGFCRKVKAAGCAGYLVSFFGRRAVYFARSGETHVEHFRD